MEELKKITFQIDELKKTKDFTTYKVSIQVPMSMGWIERMKFITETSKERHAFQMKHVKNEGDFVYFETELTLPTTALLHYYFSFEANQKFIYYKKEHQENTGSISKEDMWKKSINFEVPDWAKGKMMYHIFVDRFYKGRKEPLKEMKNRTIHTSWRDDVLVGPNQNGIWNADFYGGDLEGIIQKLDYIKSLGVSILYLSPIVTSQSNHRYDTADYKQVDPYAGTNEDLKRLCEEAHKRGMRVILDAVFNHTGNDSKYFNEYGNYTSIGAYQGKESPYYSFYRKYENNNQIFFDYWWGMTNLPVCDGNSKTWQNYIYGKDGVIDQWFSLGIDGLRLDVADELSDEFIEGIRTAVKRNKEDGFILGEVWKNPMRMNRGYLESGKGMDTVMNYPLIDALIRYYKYRDVEKLKEVLRQLKTEYPEDTLNSLMNFTSTHDITRAINIFGTKEFQYNGEWAWNLNKEDREWQRTYQMSPEDYQRGKEIYQSYLYALTFLPGNLSIFYGDEAGLQGMGNLANRRTFPWGREDQELISFLRTLGTIRKTESFLETAGIQILDINNKYFMFERIGEKESALVAISRTSDKIKPDIPKSYKDPAKTYSLKESTQEELDSHGALVLKKKTL